MPSKIHIRIVKTDIYCFSLISEQEISAGLMNCFKALCQEESIKFKIREMQLLNFSVTGKKEDVERVLYSLDRSLVVYERRKLGWQKDSRVKYLVELHPKKAHQLESLKNKLSQIKSQAKNVSFKEFPFTKIIEIPTLIKPATILRHLKTSLSNSGFTDKYIFIIENKTLADNELMDKQINDALLSQFEFDGYNYIHPFLERPIVSPQANSLKMFQDAVLEALTNYQNWYKGMRQPGGNPYRGKENGFFTRWRHTKNGQRDAQIVYAAILSKKTTLQIKKEIDNFLNQYKNGQAIHVHSFASFLLDILNQFDDSPWKHLQPNGKTNKYTYRVQL